MSQQDPTQFLKLPKQALNKLIELTKADFPNTPLHISEEGILTPVR